MTLVDSIALELKKRNKSVTEFAAELGLSRGTYYNRINAARPDKDFIKNVETALGIKIDENDLTVVQTLNQPDVSYGDSPTHSNVPVYDVDFTAGAMLNLIETRDSKYPIAFLNIPEVSGCDVVIRAKGLSMSPLINDGDWLGIKRLDNWKEWLPMGLIYAIETSEHQLVKYLKKGSSKETFTIASHNKEFEDDEIPKKVIREIWSVKTILPFSQIKTLA